MREIPFGTFKSILRQADLREEDFRRKRNKKKIGRAISTSVKTDAYMFCLRLCNFLVIARVITIPKKNMCAAAYLSVRPHPIPAKSRNREIIIKRSSLFAIFSPPFEFF